MWKQMGLVLTCRAKSSMCDFWWSNNNEGMLQQLLHTEPDNWLTDNEHAQLCFYTDNKRSSLPQTESWCIRVVACELRHFYGTTEHDAQDEQTHQRHFLLTSLPTQHQRMTAAWPVSPSTPQQQPQPQTSKNRLTAPPSVTAPPAILSSRDCSIADYS